MKATYVVAAASVLTVAAGQLSSIPPCAMQCFVSALGSDGCPIADQKCHCSQPGLQGKITPCVAASCSAADQATAFQLVVQACQQAGVPAHFTTPVFGAPTAPSPTGSPVVPAVIPVPVVPKTTLAPVVVQTVTVSVLGNGTATATATATGTGSGTATGTASGTLSSTKSGTANGTAMGTASGTATKSAASGTASASAAAIHDIGSASAGVVFGFFAALVAAFAAL